MVETAGQERGREAAFGRLLSGPPSSSGCEVCQLCTSTRAPSILSIRIPGEEKAMRSFQGEATGPEVRRLAEGHTLLCGRAKV